jgi:hypothetical protein
MDELCQACYPLFPAGQNTAELGFIYTYESMKKITIWVLVAVLIIAGALFWYKKFYHSHELVSSTDISMSKLSKTVKALPAGFPLEPLNITEQKQIDYPEHKSSLYSVVYTSEKSSAELVALYKTYLAGQGYTVTSTMDEKAGTAYITSRKGNDDIAISFSPISGKTNVSVSVVTRE